MFNNKFSEIVTKATHDFFQHEAITRAASIAFYAALSLSPLLLLFIAISSFIEPTAFDYVLKQVHLTMGEESKELLRLIVETAQSSREKSIISVIIGSFILLFSSSAVFVELRSAMSHIWGISSPRSSTLYTWVKKRIFSMGLVLIFITLILLGVSLNTAFHLFYPSSGFVSILNSFLTLIFFTLLFTFFFKILPKLHVSWKTSFLGGFSTAFLLGIGKYLVSMYIKYSSLSSAYGAAGSLIILLLWVYYSSLIILFGVELTQSYGALVSRKK